MYTKKSKYPFGKLYVPSFEELHYNKRFRDLHYTDFNNKYLTMQRVSDDEEKIVVKVADSRLKKIEYGYKFILDYKRDIYLHIRDCEVSCNYYGNEVLLARSFFKILCSCKFHGLGPKDIENELTFDYWLEIAKKQSNTTYVEGSCVQIPVNPVFWKKDYKGIW